VAGYCERLQMQVALALLDKTYVSGKTVIPLSMQCSVLECFAVVEWLYVLVSLVSFLTTGLLLCH